MHVCNSVIFRVLREAYYFLSGIQIFIKCQNIFRMNGAYMRSQDVDVESEGNVM